MNLLGIITRVFLGSTSPQAQPAPAKPAIVVAVTNPTGTVAANSVSAAESVDKVQKFYSSVNQVSALFRQTVTYATFGTTKASDGKMWLQKPGKMRWDYSEKKKAVTVQKKSFISNGAYLYMVEHDNKQVVKKNLQNDLMPVAVSFLYGKGDLKAEFNADLDKSGKFGKKDEIVLRLTPKKPSAQYKSLTLVVAPSDFHVTQSIIIDSSDNVNHFQFYAPDFKATVDARWFEFDERSVKNYRIVDADQQQQGAGSATPEPTLIQPTPAPKTPKK
ncbi:MAG: outer membrane lipoprotein carrier protein LolA [Deltaproteobacteria bacterium]|nr:outer membrane lipoprotein carrier protein LolA [Deltaproteobacteria bacterium]